MKVDLPDISFCPQCGEPLLMKYAEGRDRPVCDSCGKVVYINPIPASCVVVADGGKLLLTKRAVEPQKGQWCLPGGFMEWSESPEEAAHRELNEETGIEAGRLTCVGVYSSSSMPKRHVILVAYFTGEWEGDAIAGDDASDVGWFALSDMPKLAFSVHEQAVSECRERGLFE